MNQGTPWAALVTNRLDRDNTIELPQCRGSSFLPPYADRVLKYHKFCYTIYNTWLLKNPVVPDHYSPNLILDEQHALTVYVLVMPYCPQCAGRVYWPTFCIICAKQRSSSELYGMRRD